MPEGNPLVAESKKDGDGPGPLTAGNGDYGYAGGIGLAESAMDTFNGIKDGDWVSGGLGMLSLAGEVASAATDPFGYLMSSVASFLMEHIQPLKDMLDSLAGNPPVIQSYADTWGNISKALGERKTDLDNAVKNGTTGWSGAAADAYRKQAAEHGEALSSAATVAGGISTAVMIFGQIVSFVRETVRQLIADLVGKLISWVMEEVFSLGFGTPVVVAQASAAIAKWGEKIAGLLKKLTDAIRRISPLLSKLVDIFEKIAKIFGKVLGKVSGLDGVKIKEGGFAHRIPKGEGGGVHARAHGEGGEGGSHGDGDSPPDGDGSHSGDGDSSHGGEGDSSPDGDSSPSGSDSPSSDPAHTDGSSSPGSDSGSRRSSGGDEGSPSSARGDDGAPTHAGDGDSTPSSSHPDNLTSSPSARSSDGGGSPSHHSGDSSPSTHAGDSSPTHAGDSSPSPARHAADSSSSPTHAGDSSPSPTRGAGDSSPSPARHAGDSSPAPTHAGDSSPSPTRGAGDSSPSPTHAGDSTPSARSAAPSHADGGAPSTHGGAETPSSAASPRTSDGTTASGTAPTTPRTGDPAPSGVPSPRGGDGVSQPGVPPQGGMMGGGMPPGGAPGGGGGLGASPGRTGGGAGWTGTPGSPGAHTPHVPEPSARPRGGPEPVARGPQGTTTPTHGPGTRPGGNGPGGRPNGPGHTGPGGSHGPGDGTPGHHGPSDHDGGTPHHDPDGGPHHEPLSPDEVNARHAEDTPAGSSYHAGDPEMGDLPHRVQPDPDGRYTVDVHVTKDGYARIGDRLYTPEEFADILRRNGTYDGSPIRLIGCDAGSNDFAHRLSRELDTEVMAPNKPAWTDSHGRVFSSDYEIGPDGKMRPRIPPDGEWSTHHPDGSTHRAGEDGFAPDSRHHDPNDVDADSARHRGEDDADTGSDGHHNDGDDDPDLDPEYDAPPPTRVIDENTPEYHERFVDYDRPGHDGGHNPYDRPHPTPPDPGSPQEIHAEHRGRDTTEPGAPPHADEVAERIPAPLADHQPLHPHTEYQVHNPNGTKTSYFTDENGDVKWAEAETGRKSGGTKSDGSGFNPDLNYPLLGDVQYRVNNFNDPDKHWDFHTDEHGQTDAMSGDPSYQKSNPDRRDDINDAGKDSYSAQGRAGKEGDAAYAGHPEHEPVKWHGGHMAANESGGPGEYINMYGQMAGSNSGNARDGWIHDASWRRQEKDLNSFAGVPHQDVQNYQVRMTRTESGVPDAVTMRWQEVTYKTGPDGKPLHDAGGNLIEESRVTKERVFPNDPDKVNYGPVQRYKDKQGPAGSS